MVILMLILGMTITKTCNKCGEQKPSTDFYKKMGRCKPCHRIDVYAWQAKNPEKVKQALIDWRDKPGNNITENLAARRWQEDNALYLKVRRVITGIHKYGLTLNEWLDKHIEQNFVCAVCNGITPRGLNIDHDHATGKVRKLLCNVCNAAIGGFKEDPELFKRAVAYLEEHKQL